MSLALRNRNGFTLVEVMIVVAIIGLLATIAFPNLIRARTTGQAKFCIDNLRLIDGAKQEWALEKKILATETPTAADIQPYLGRGDGVLPLCPTDSSRTFGTSYILNDLRTPPVCKASPESHIFEP